MAATLTRFSVSVVEYVTDPRTGIPSSCEWLPSVAEVKAACVARGDYLARLRDWDSRFGSRPRVLALPLDRATPGRRANVFVSVDSLLFPRAYELAQTADRADWKSDPAGRPGIWIGLNLLERVTSRKPEEPQRFTDDDLRAYYGQRAIEQPEAAE